MSLTAEHLMLAAGVGTFLLTLYWVRSRDLLERYAVLWIGASVLALVCGIYPDLIKNLASAARLSYPSAVLFAALTAFYLFAFSVSVWLTRHYRQNIRLTQELALMEERVRALETALARSAAEQLTTQGPPPPSRIAGTP